MMWKMWKADERRVLRTSFGWCKREYRVCRNEGGSVFNSAGYAWFSSRPIRTAKWLRAKPKPIRGPQ